MAISKIILNGVTQIDLTGDSVAANVLLTDETAHNNAGLPVVGSYAPAAGSATTPATTITANPSISVRSGGLITASVSGSQSITPTVVEGWVSSGTAGTVSVSGSNTSQLTTKSAATYTPSTSTQTIASGQYLTGTQTINPIPSQYIVPSGNKEITANGTNIDVAAYSTVSVAVPTGPAKNVQGYRGYATVTSTSYTATAVSVTVAKTGTYNVSWMGYRNRNSGTHGSQLYKNGTAVGTANTTFINTYGHYVSLTNQAFEEGDVLVVRARSSSSTYYTGVGNLIIEEV